MTRPLHRHPGRGLALAAATMLAGGCASTGSTSGRSVSTTTTVAMTGHTTASKGLFNSACPVSGRGVDGRTTVAYRTRTIGFCGPGCLDAWARMTPVQKDAFVARNTIR